MMQRSKRKRSITRSFGAIEKTKSLKTKSISTRGFRSSAWGSSDSDSSQAIRNKCAIKQSIRGSKRSESNGPVRNRQKFLNRKKKTDSTAWDSSDSDSLHATKSLQCVRRSKRAASRTPQSKRSPTRESKRSPIRGSKRSESNGPLRKPMPMEVEPSRKELSGPSSSPKKTISPTNMSGAAPSSPTNMSGAAPSSAPIGYLNLIGGQQFDGHFNLPITTFSQDNEVMEKLRKILQSVDAKNQTRIVLLTAMAIYTLHKYFNNKKSEWVLMENKAKVFITKNVNEAIANELFSVIFH